MQPTDYIFIIASSKAARTKVKKCMIFIYYITMRINLPTAEFATQLPKRTYTADEDTVVVTE